MPRVNCFQSKLAGEKILINIANEIFDKLPRDGALGRINDTIFLKKMIKDTNVWILYLFMNA